MRKWAWLLVLVLVSGAFAKDKFQEPGPVQLTKDGQKWAERQLKKMSLEQKIGQMLMVKAEAGFINVRSPEYAKLSSIIQKYHVGGFLLTVRAEGPYVYRNQPYEAVMLTNALQRESKVPLIFAADFERGLAMRLYATTGFPHSMALAATGNPQYAEDMGRIVAVESRAIGVQWNFFPIADVNSNPDNPIINIRSFGEDPQQVGDFVAAYIRGSRQNGVMTTAKHFPGHGDVDTDTHVNLARVNADRAHLDAVDLPPFRRAIEAGTDAVMVAHVIVPALDPDPNHEASTSSAVVTDLLKHQMGFKGLIVPDALDMAGVTQLYPAPGRAAVEAVKAGEDMVLVPVDLEAAHNALLAAVQTGEIPESRIDESVLKILQAKASVGLDKARLVDVNRLAQLVSQPDSLAKAQQIADDAVTLVRSEDGVLPLKARTKGTYGASNPYEEEEEGNRVLAVIFVDDVRGDNGRDFEHELRARVPDARVVYVDPRTAGPMTDHILQQADRAETVIAAAYSIPSAGRTARVEGKRKSTAEIGDAERNLMGSLVSTVPGKLVVIALGSPYMASLFPDVENYMCTFSNAPVSETSAVRALFGEIPIRGKLPVTIPGVAPRGTGLSLPARAASAPAARPHHGGSYATH